MTVLKRTRRGHAKRTSQALTCLACNEGSNGKEDGIGVLLSDAKHFTQTHDARTVYGENVE